MTERTHHRICLVIDILTEDPDHTLTRRTSNWLGHITSHIADHTITATPVRYDIDGSPTLTHHPQ